LNIRVQIGLIDHQFIVLLLFLFYLFFRLRVINHSRLYHSSKHAIEFKCDVLVLYLTLGLSPLDEEAFSGVLDSMEVKSVEYSANTFGDSLLLMV
jgi:hypothetical protein